MASKDISSLYFFSTGSYPYGNAATNRALSYMRGLSELGYNVTLYLLSPEKNQSPLSSKKKNIYHGVQIIYTSFVLFPNNKFFRAVNLIGGVIVGYVYLFGALIKDRKKAPFILLLTNPIILFLFLSTIKIFGAKGFHERTEFPFLNIRSNISYKFYVKWIIPLFNGIYVISYSLLDYFKDLTPKPLLLLPMTVELDRFHINRDEVVEPYIAYCGSMYTNKDGIPDLIDAFNHIAAEYSELKLYLIGDNSDKIKFRPIYDKISESKFHDRIICTGEVERDEIPKLLKNATILALCRPSNIQAQGGFPTKLGEYLATANPVVITDVGDHGRYLKDRVSAFIARPGDPYSFATKMLECLNDPVLAESVGKNGYDMAMQHFNYKTQAVILCNFFKGNL